MSLATRSTRLAEPMLPGPAAPWPSLAPRGSGEGIESLTGAGMPLVPAACRNCAHPIDGAFCAGCGQRGDVTRLTVAGIVADFLGQLAVLDRGLWYTALELTRNPGRVGAPVRER